MAKQPFQDVVPSKRSIRDVPVPMRRREPARAIVTDSVLPKSEIKKDYPFEYDIDRPRTGNHKGLWTLGIIFILAAVFGVVSLFASAKVVVTTKSQIIPADVNLTVAKDQPAGVFGYQLVSVSSSTTAEAVAGAQAQVSTKASGTIVVYNTSTKVQNLVATTRFQTASGLLYRAVKPVSVPAGTQGAPGSAVAQVAADQPGSTYNVGPSDFTLPGLKGTPQYSTVYGRSQNSMSGGFVGNQKSVDEATLASTTVTMQNNLKTQLQSQIAAQIPNTFILYPSSVSFVFGGVTQSSDTDPAKANLVLSGTATAIIFDKVLLSQAMINALNAQLTNGPQGAPAMVKNLDKLNFTLKQPTTLSQNYAGTVSFELAGDATVQWLFDQTALKSDLVGLKKSNLNALLQAKYPTIDSATAKIFPIWKTSFPSDPKKISITEAGN